VFFHTVEQELMQQLRERMEAERTREAIQHVTGISDEKVLNELVELGIKTETLVALSLVPCILVAWADRIVERKEREAVLKAAEGRGCVKDGPSYRLIEHWLKRRPDDEFVADWKDIVAALAQVTKPEFMSALSDDLMRRARTVAQAAGGFLGRGAVSKAEEATLADLEAAFTAAKQ
jgi:hypothetical protein